MSMYNLSQYVMSANVVAASPLLRNCDSDKLATFVKCLVDSLPQQLALLETLPERLEVLYGRFEMFNLGSEGTNLINR